MWCVYVSLQEYQALLCDLQTYKEKLAHAPGALELLEKLLCMDPKRRISASDALQVSTVNPHSYPEQ